MVDTRPGKSRFRGAIEPGVVAIPRSNPRVQCHLGKTLRQRRRERDLEAWLTMGRAHEWRTQPDPAERAKIVAVASGEPMQQEECPRGMGEDPRW